MLLGYWVLLAVLVIVCSLLFRLFTTKINDRYFSCFAASRDRTPVSTVANRVCTSRLSAFMELDHLPALATRATLCDTPCHRTVCRVCRRRLRGGTSVYELR
eukprot:XP_001710214.1 Hypothetical protein GL50803_20517 [Giardia lamblia ATCC 50803]